VAYIKGEIWVKLKKASNNIKGENANILIYLKNS
jgi:hypothetical protein